MAKAPSEICNHTVEWHTTMKASVFPLHSSEFIQGPLRKRLTTMTHKASSAPVTIKLIGKWLIQENLLSCWQVSKKCCYILTYEVLMSPHEITALFHWPSAIWASRRRILSSSKTWAGRSLWTSSMKMFGIPDSNSPQGCHKKHHDGKHFFWVSLSIYAYVGNDHNTKKSCTGYCISI